MIRYLSFLWALLAPFTAAGNNTAAADLALYRKMVYELSAESMEGRGPGTLGLERARDYLVAYFQSIGLAPAFGDRYCQELEIRPGGRYTTALLRVGDQFARRGADFSPHPLSADGRFAAPPLIVAERALRDGTAGIPIADKVLLVLGERRADAGAADAAALSALARAASAGGASALLLVDDGPLPVLNLKDLKHTAREEKAPLPVLILMADYLTAVNAFGLNAERFSRDGCFLTGVTLEGKVSMTGKAVTVHNVAGVLPGAGSLALEYVIVGGHYDHLGFGGKRTGTQQLTRGIHPGADDNASGIAGVLLLATRCARDAAGAGPNRRGLIFAGFTAEETGLEGSSYMAANLAELGISHDQVAAMLNFDMIGRMNGDVFFLSGWETGYGWWRQAREVSRQAGLEVVREKDYFHRSDQYSFYLKAIPCLFFFAGNHGDYHTVADTADKINYRGALRLLAVGQALLQEQWSNPERLRFRRIPRRQGNLR